MNSLPTDAADGAWDDFLGGKVRLYQTKNGYRATSDAVILAAAVNAGKNDCILDAGCGTGAVSLCLHWRCPDTFITGLDIQAEMTAAFAANVSFNGKQNFITAVTGDLCARPCPVPSNAFDWVVTNPPFTVETPVSPSELKDTAHRQSAYSLAQWIRSCLKCLKPMGRFVMINRADRLPEIAALLYGELGGVTITPIFTKQGRPAKRIVVSGRKGVKSPAVLNDGVVLNDSSGKRTQIAENIMRGGAALWPRTL